MVMTKGSATRESALREVDRERQIENITRRTRVEILGLPYCRVCGGATGDTADVELVCVCMIRQVELQRRVAKIRDRLRGDREPVPNFSDVVAP